MSARAAQRPVISIVSTTKPPAIEGFECAHVVAVAMPVVDQLGVEAFGASALLLGHGHGRLDQRRIALVEHEEYERASPVDELRSASTAS